MFCLFFPFWLDQLTTASKIKIQLEIKEKKNKKEQTQAKSDFVVSSGLVFFHFAQLCTRR